MTITVEDGSIVTGANSYVSLDDARTFAAARGVTLSAVDATLEPIVIQAMDYLESFSDKFKGELTLRDQPLSWPRSGAVIENWTWDSDEIPRQVINALNQLIVAINAGTDPHNPPTVDNLPKIEETVHGAITVKYANPSTPGKVTKDQDYSTTIRLLLKNSGLFAVRA